MNGNAVQSCNCYAISEYDVTGDYREKSTFFQTAEVQRKLFGALSIAPAHALG